jgi:hypothetical protein
MVRKNASFEREIFSKSAVAPKAEKSATGDEKGSERERWGGRETDLF